MKLWYALDYVNGDECELVYNDQLYATETAAQAAREATDRPDLFDISWYGMADLQEIFNGEVDIDKNLLVHSIP